MTGVSKESVFPEEQAKAYDTLLKCREIDLNLFVARSNVCIVLQGALLAFIAKPLIEFNPQVTFANKVMVLFLSLLGLSLSFISMRLVNGSSFWVSYWEHRLCEVEKNVLPNVLIFQDQPSSRNIDLLKRLPSHLKYVSSRQSMRWFFILFTLLWVLLFLFILVEWC